MKRLVIAIDCDDVLVPTASWIIRAYNTKYSTNLSVDDFYARDPLTWRVDNFDEAVQRVGELFQAIDRATFTPFEDAITVVKKLADDGHELHLVTGRSPTLEPITNAMAEKYFNGCFESIEHTGHFDKISRSKGEVCTQISADILIDDHLDHLSSVLEAGLKEVILFGDYAWNQKADLPSGVRRCVDWPAVEREVTRISEGTRE